MTTVAVLGTGIMGSGMARSLLRAGLDVVVWNRSADKAEALRADGARVATDPTTAVAGADVVLTMLFDTDSVQAVMDDVLPQLGAHAVWVQSSTVGLDGVARLSALADRHDVDFLDAPVLGTKKPAQDGALTVLVGGPQRLRPAVTPVFEAIGAATVWVGEAPGDGHRLKLVANSWVLSLTAATGQAVAFARGLGIDPDLFLDAVADGPLDCGYLQLKGRAMLDGALDPAFTLDGARKDAALIGAALDGADVSSEVVRAIAGRLDVASSDGFGDRDMAAVVHGF